MSERPLDAEQVAALLDGRLSASEREHVLAQIAADPEWREVLADAAAVVERPTVSDESLDVAHVARSEAPHESPRAAAVDRSDRRSVRWAPMLLAASVLLAVALGTWRLTTRTNSPFGPAESVLAVASQASSEFARDQITLDARWPRVRALSETLSPRAIGVRVGVMAVDMLALMQSPDSATLSIVREELLTTLQLVPGSGPMVSGIQNATTLIALEQALRSTRLLVDSTAFDAGAWIEVARLSGADEARRQSSLRNAKTAAARFGAQSDALRLFDTLEALREPAARQQESRALLDSLLRSLAR